MAIAPRGSIEEMTARSTYEFVDDLLHEHMAPHLLEAELRRLYEHGSTSVRLALRDSNEALRAYGYKPVAYEHVTH